MITRNWGLVGSRRSAGGLTTLNYKGQTVIKQKRAKGQSNPSPEYLQCQAAYNLLLTAFQAEKEIIQQGYTNPRKAPTTWNEFYTYGRANALDLSSPPAATLLPNKLLFSKGKMINTEISSASASILSNEIDIFWDGSKIYQGQDQNDIALRVYYNLTKGLWLPPDVNTAVRMTGSVGITPPPGWLTLADTIYIWLGFLANSTGPYKGSSSNSTFTSVITTV